MSGPQFPHKQGNPRGLTDVETPVQITEARIRDLVRRIIGEARAFAVGAVYTNVTGVNPGIELGYGTWVAFSQGRALFGFSGVAPFDVVEAAVGAATHLHIYSDLPQHGHTLTLINNLHLHANDINTANPSGTSGGSASIQGSNADPNATKNTQNAATSVTGTADNAGVASPQTATASSLPPGTVVYFWKRTA